jgi:ribonuclease BN (tRNA processing enzyme)
MPKAPSSLLLAAALLGTSWLCVDPVSAQSSTAPRAGTRLITIGTAAGPTPRAKRAQTSNLLIVDGTPYLIDAGDGTTRRLGKMGFNFRQLGTIFVTHGHDDHTGGLGMLLSVVWNAARTDPINVYGPPGTATLIEAAKSYYNQSAEIRISDGSRTVPISKVFFGHDVSPGVVYRDAKVTVTAVENSHFNFPPGSPAYGKYKSYSYRFDTADRVIAFTGDTGPSDALTEMIKNADVLVTEVGSPQDLIELRRRTGRWDVMSPKEQEEYVRHQMKEHLTTEDVGHMAAKAGVKTVILTHLSSRPGGDDYMPWVDEVKKHFSGQVLVADDLKEF